jgi:hypothetical protein
VVAAIDGVRGRARLPARAAAVLGLTGASVAGLHGYVALWPMVFETRAQVDLMESLTRDADIRTRFVMLRIGGMPSRLNAGYADVTLFNPYFDEPVSYDLWDPTDPNLAERKATFPNEEDLKTMNTEMTSGGYVVYVIFSEQSNKAIRYYGDFRTDAVEVVQEALREAPQWELIYDEGETKVWRSINDDLAPENRDGQP